MLTRRLAEPGAVLKGSVLTSGFLAGLLRESV